MRLVRWVVAGWAVAVVLAAEAFSDTNVLLIYADQYRFDCIGAAGHPDIKTPNLDALAADGVLYTNSFCTWPVCTPSRLSILSGLYVAQHRGRSNRSTMPPGTPTFASILREGGYGTTALGKMHLTPAYQDVGFDTMILAEQNGRGRNIDDYHRYLRERGLINAIDLIDQERPYRDRAPANYRETFGARVSDLPEEHHITTWVGDRAVDSIATWTPDKPQALMVGFLKPHHPFDPPAPWHEMYDPDALTVLPGWTDAVPANDSARARGYFDYSTLTLPALRRAMAYYYATISHMDAQIGRLVEELKRRGLYDDTLIVFTADHGEFLGFHHLLLKGNHMYDPLVKVPLIVKFPRQREAGTVTDELVNALDVTVTILRETGHEPTSEMRGEALGVLNVGREDARPYVVAEDARGAMIRTKTRKLLYYGEGSDSLFFDLEEDPLELVNSIEDERYAKDVAALKEHLLSWYLRRSHRFTYVDTDAPVIEGPNVPRNPDALEREMLRYFDEKVSEFLERDTWQPER